MRIAVFGLWHLGCVTSACLAAAGHQVIGIDPSQETVDRLRAGRAPIMEPGLDELLGRVVATGALAFTTDPHAAVADADLVWVAFDTPVDDQDVADVAYVVRQSESLFPYLREDAVVLFSSQLPVGTTARIEAAFRGAFPNKNVHFGYVPENLRLGKAMECFTHPDRFIVGTSSEAAYTRVASALEPITRNLEPMSVASAEMTKHGINAFLAMCVVFANELAGICEQVGADAKEVERGLKSEQRIGPHAYLSPGAAFAGGTLARDVRFLEQTGRDKPATLQLIRSILPSNERHKHWALDKLRDVLGELGGRTVAVLGLTYKPGTSTLRRSSSMETCRALAQEGARIQAYDPGVTTLPGNFPFIHLMRHAEAALEGADALLVQTPWADFQTLTAESVIGRLKRPVVMDPGGYLTALQRVPGLQYFAIGRSFRS